MEGSVVGHGQRSGASARGSRSEGDIDSASSARCDAGSAVVGLTEVAAGGDIGDGKRPGLNIPQSHWLGEAGDADRARHIGQRAGTNRDRQQAIHIQFCLRSEVDVTIGDGGREKLGARSGLIARGILIAVVERLGELVAS